MAVVLQSDRKSVKYLLRLLSPAPGETHLLYFERGRCCSVALAKFLVLPLECVYMHCEYLQNDGATGVAGEMLV